MLRRTSSTLGWTAATALVLGATYGNAVQAQGEEGFLFVTSWSTDSVLRYDALTGEFVDEFASRRAGAGPTTVGLNQPWSAVISPHDGSLVVPSGHFTGQRDVLRFDGASGAFLEAFGSEIVQPHAGIFGPDGNFYVGEQLMDGRGAMARFDGVTGDFMDYFIAPGSGGIDHPTAQVFVPSGDRTGEYDLLVTDADTKSVLRYDGSTGAFIDEFIPSGAGGMEDPFGIVLGPDGNLYIANSKLDGGSVFSFQGPLGTSPGELVGNFVPMGSGGLLAPFGLLFGPDATGDGHQELYVSSQEVNPGSFRAAPGTSSIKIYNGATGEFVRDFISADNNGGLAGPNLMTFTRTNPVTLEYPGAATSAASGVVVPEPTSMALCLAVVLCLGSSRHVWTYRADLLRKCQTRKWKEAAMRFQMCEAPSKTSWKPAISSIVVLLSLATADAQPPGTYLTVFGGAEYSAQHGGYLNHFGVSVDENGVVLNSAFYINDFGVNEGIRSLTWDASRAPAIEFAEPTFPRRWNYRIEAVAQNIGGTAVGSATMSDVIMSRALGAHALRWDAVDVSPTVLDHLGTSASGSFGASAVDINDAGTVVGSSVKYDAAGNSIGTRAVLWEAGGVEITELGHLGVDESGSTTAEARAISENGTIVGRAIKYSPEFAYLGDKAVRWDPGQAVATELGSLGVGIGGFSATSAAAINDEGTIVGVSNKFDEFGNELGDRAVRWDAGTTTAVELGHLGSLGPEPIFFQMSAHVINDHGAIFGSVDEFDDQDAFLRRRAVRWDAGTTEAIALAILQDGSNEFSSYAPLAANNADVAVGRADYSTAIYWRADGSIVDLNTLIDPSSRWVLEQATDISDSGWIAGTGKFDPDGNGVQEPYTRAFLMHVPETAVRGVPGDYNADGVVDAADYTVWRDSLGAPAGTLPNDPNSGDIGAAHYATWQENYGATAATAAGVNEAAVPEPAGLLVILLSCTLFNAMRRRS